MASKTILGSVCLLAVVVLAAPMPAAAQADRARGEEPQPEQVATPALELLDRLPDLTDHRLGRAALVAALETGRALLERPTVRATLEAYHAHRRAVGSGNLDREGHTFQFR